MRIMALWLVLLLAAAESHAYEFWNDIRNSALLPDSTITVRTENLYGAGIQNFLLYASSGIQEAPMGWIADGPSTIAADGRGPVGEQRYYGFRLIQGEELDLMPVRIADGVEPVPADLTRLAADPAGDEQFGYSHLDLVDCRVSFSDDRFYVSLTNAGGGFPVSSGLTFFGYLLGIANPAVEEPDTVYGIMQTYYAAGIIGPGLYRIEGTGLGDLVKLGDITVEEFPEINTLLMSCNLEDLMDDPYLLSWFDPSDPCLGVAAFTQRISLLGGAAAADRSPGGRCYLREWVVAPAANQLPALSSFSIEGSGASAYAEIVYSDPDGNCPVISEIAFDGTLVYAMFPSSLDYSAPVTYRTDAGVAPLADESWSNAVVRFSDNRADTVTFETSVTGTAGEETTPPAIRCSTAPNPFNATTVIRFDLPREGHVTLRVYSVRGELIGTIVDRHMTEGEHEVVWHARDYRGKTLSSGVYFYRLEAGGATWSGKAVLMR